MAEEITSTSRQVLPDNSLQVIAHIREVGTLEGKAVVFSFPQGSIPSDSDILTKRLQGKGVEVTGLVVVYPPPMPLMVEGA